MTEELLKKNVFRPARADGVWKVRAVKEEQSLCCTFSWWSRSLKFFYGSLVVLSLVRAAIVIAESWRAQLPNRAGSGFGS